MTTGDRGRWVGYERMAQHVWPAAQRLLDLVGPPVAGGPLLDVGTGTGTALTPAVERGWHPIGLDRSADQLASIENTRGPLLLADGAAIPLADRSITAAVSNFALIFAPDPGAVLGEIARCLSIGGACAWSAWSPGGWPGAWRLILAEATGRAAPPFPVTLGEDALARAAMDEAGFGSVSVEQRRLRWDVTDAGDAVDLLTTAAGGLRVLRRDVEAAGVWPETRARLVDDATARLVEGPTGMAIDDAYLAVVGVVG
ncbi:MAG: class I SAM-dependent methyltransferase [Actinomycetota bacterium]